jgi:hypothetical protein
MISFPPIALVDGLQRHAPVAHSYPVGADEQHPADESRRMEEVELAGRRCDGYAHRLPCCGCCNRIGEKSCDTDLARASPLE